LKLPANERADVARKSVSDLTRCRRDRMRRLLGSIFLAAAVLATGCGDAPTTTSARSVNAYVVWSHSNGAEPRIYAASSLDSSPVAISSIPGDQYSPAVSGDWIAWADKSAGDTDIVLMDRNTGQVRVAAAGERSRWFPAVSEDWLVWTDSIRAGKQIRALSLRSGQRLALGGPRLSMSEPRPQLSGSWVTWLQQGRRRTTVWAYDLDARRLVRIARGQCTAPSIADGVLAYRDAAGIHCVDTVSRKELRFVRLGRHSDVVGSPLTSTGQVLWMTASENGTVFDLWTCGVDTGRQRLLTTLSDMDASMGLAVSGHMLVYLGVPDAHGVVTVKTVDLRSARVQVLARQAGLLTGPAIFVE
jgi:beta propeller repeat protein